MRTHIGRLALATTFVTWMLVTALLGLGAGVPAASAQARTHRFLSTTVLGDLQQIATANRGRVHVSGSLGLATADYFRGAFDDVREDFDELAWGPDLSVAFELVRGRPGPVQDLTLTLGTQNNLAPQVQPTDARNRDWYESNNFAGLALGLPGDWTAGAIYTIYTSPNGVSPTFQELALALKHPATLLGVSLNPQAKVVIPLERVNAAFHTGVFTELTVAPEFKVLADMLTLRVPLTLGIGKDDYYGPGAGTSVFGAGGISAAVPLAFIPSSLGSWKFTVAVDAIVRDDEIEALGGRFDDAGSVVLIGRAAIGFAY